MNVATSLRGFLETMNHARERARNKALSVLAGPRPLTAGEQEILAVLYARQNQECRFAELVDELERRQGAPINTSTISQSIGRLAKDDLVRRTYPDGPRHPLLALEIKGCRVARAMDEVDKFWVPKLLAVASLSPKDEDTLAAIMDRSVAALAEFESDSVFNAVGKARMAGVYDYLLGGQFYTRADGIAAAELEKDIPWAAAAARSNRAFVRRAVSFMVQSGVEQFIDVGSGLPTTGSTHEVARDLCPACRVLYVDIDEYVWKVGDLLARELDGVRAVRHDLRDVDKIIREAEACGIVLSKPVGLIFAAVLHFVEDIGTAAAAVRAFRDRLAPGSYVAISHAHFPPRFEHPGGKIIERYRQLVGKAYVRPQKDILCLFEGMHLVNPDSISDETEGMRLVFAPTWRPRIDDRYLWGEKPPLSDDPESSMLLVGVAST